MFIIWFCANVTWEPLWCDECVGIYKTHLDLIALQNLNEPEITMAAAWNVGIWISTTISNISIRSVFFLSHSISSTLYVCLVGVPEMEFHENGLESHI